MTYKLNANQTLSDLNVQLNKNCILISPTGSGKSYFVAKTLKQKRIMAVPTTALCLQFQKEYQAGIYFSQSRDFKGKDFIVTTYHSLPKLIAEIGDVSDYDLFVDEAHNLVASANREFLLLQLVEMVNSFNKFKNFYLLTATPLYCFHPVLKDLPVINVKGVNKIKKTFKTVRYTDILKTVKDITDLSKGNNRQFAILCNTVKEYGKLSKLRATLSDRNIAIINSTKKNEEDFEEIVVNGDFSKLEGMIMTTVLKEGNSIVTHSPEIDVIAIGEFHPIELEQVCARFRKADKINLYLLKSKTYTFNQFDFKKNNRIKKISEIAKTVYELNGSINELNEGISTIINVLPEVYGDFLIGNNNKVEINYLGMSNLLFTQERKSLNKNVQSMATFLYDYGWLFEGIEENITKLDTELKQQIETYNTQQIQTHNDFVKSIEEKILEYNSGHNEIMLENTRDMMPEEIELRDRVSYINKFFDKSDLTPAIELSKKYTKKSWVVLKLKVEMQKIKLTPDATHPIAKYVRFIYDKIKLNQNYEVSILLQLLKDGADLCGLDKNGLKIIENVYNMRRFFSTMFKVDKLEKKSSKPTVQKRNPNGADIYVFQNDNPTPFSHFELSRGLSISEELTFDNFDKWFF